MRGLDHGLELGVVLAQSIEEENRAEVVAVERADRENPCV
jgi:hypothetical protein